MCWSFEVSLGTLIFAGLGSLYLYNRNRPNDRFYAVYIFLISLMQVADALAWYSLNNKLPSLNNFAGILSRILISIQIPLIYWYLYKTTNDKKYLNVCIAYIGYFIYLGYLIQKEHSEYKITTKLNCQNSCHLEWSWLYPITTKKYWIPFIFYSGLLLYPLLKKNIWMILVAVTTFIFSIYKYGKTKIWGSYWCSVINIWVLFAIFFN